MAAKLTARPLTFAVPQVGAPGSLLPQQAALGTTARIRQTAPGYFNVMVQEHGNALGELRLYIVRKAVAFEEATTEGYWVVERPTASLGYEKASQFKPSHLRHALGWAVKQVTADWIIEVRNGDTAR